MTEHDRRALFDWIAGNVGDGPAEALMQRLPAHSLADLATRDDLLALAAALRGEMAELRGELRGEMAELRGEMAELRGEMAELRGEIHSLHADSQGSITALASTMSDRFDRQQRWFVGALIAHAGIGTALTASLVALT